MNVVVVKMRECLLDAYIGENNGPCTTYLTHTTRQFSYEITTLYFTEQARWKDGLQVASLLQPAYE